MNHTSIKRGLAQQVPLVDVHQQLWCCHFGTTIALTTRKRQLLFRQPRTTRHRRRRLLLIYTGLCVVLQIISLFKCDLLNGQRCWLSTGSISIWIRYLDGQWQQHRLIKYSGIVRIDPSHRGGRLPPGRTVLTKKNEVAIFLLELLLMLLLEKVLLLLEVMVVPLQIGPRAGTGPLDGRHRAAYLAGPVHGGLCASARIYIN